MPAPADQLAEQYRVQQATIGATTAVVMLRLWPLLVGASSQEETDRWVEAVIRIITAQRARSAASGQAFILGLRRQALGDTVEPFTPVVVDPNLDRIRTSLYVTGVNRLQSERLAAEKARARTEPDARPPTPAPIPLQTLEKIQTSVAAAAQRHALDGGRTALEDAIERDPRAIGYQRLGRAKPCFWCAMLNSRGPVYKEVSFESSDDRFSGPGNAKCHDGCGCSLVPLYTRAGLADTVQPALEKQWADLTKGKSGRAAIKAFRQGYEGRERV